MMLIRRSIRPNGHGKLFGWVEIVNTPDDMPHETIAGLRFELNDLEAEVSAYRTLAKLRPLVADGA